MCRIVIDCDPGIDDSLALMLALASPELNIAGSQLFPEMFLLIWERRMLQRY